MDWFQRITGFSEGRYEDTRRRLPVQGDVRKLHADPASAGALFQVASQFNLLEMVGPGVSPEDRVTGYAHDRTQGPACAMAAGAATIFRNYLVQLPAGSGQTSDRQVDAIADLGAALGNAGGRLWRMRNGYALLTQQGLGAANAVLAGADEPQLDAWRALLRIGVHANVQVTDAPIATSACRRRSAPPCP